MLSNNTEKNEIAPVSIPINLNDYQKLARAKLPKMVYDYFAGAAEDEFTHQRNQSEYQDWLLNYRVLTGVAQRNPGVNLLGKHYSYPFAVAPMAFHQLAHPAGECGVAQAAAKMRIPFTVSTMSNASLEEIAMSSTGDKWFQLYVFKDRGLTKSIVQRAEAAGYQMFQVTVDVPVLGRRERDMRNAFTLPEGLTIKNFEDNSTASHFVGEHGKVGQAVYTLCHFDAGLNWKDIEWLCQLTSLPVLVKGIINAEDAFLALNHGAAGVVVSNHGGRQLDSVPSTIEVLPEICDRLAGQGAVLIDGGIRRGTDIIKALALGADFVQIGRPMLWGLALEGKSGVEKVMQILIDELDTAMALMGIERIDQLNRSMIVSRRGRGK